MNQQVNATNVLKLAEFVGYDSRKVLRAARLRYAKKIGWKILRKEKE